MEQTNRLKILLVGQNETGEWLTETYGKNNATVSRWFTNEFQPSLETLLKIANGLNVDAKELLVSIMKSK